MTKEKVIFYLKDNLLDYRKEEEKIELDLRGLSCPIPVAKTKRALEENPSSEVIALVDNAVARDNVARLAKSKGYAVELEEIESCFRLTLRRKEKM
ncbi:MAG: sulfurtransferase TusA family protein [Candidatus Subteraquimicrobiales bacterium]|nr:sulfurtransferase TusA family protein [Candidatus Subteraquimicrobiales bacterium]